jgi:hypothetical protein
MRLATAVVLAGSCILAATAQPVSGQRPDPDSPAGVEYQVPLDRARDEASGGDAPTGRPEARSSAEGETAAADQLFGAGIQPRSGSSDAPRGEATGEQGRSSEAERPGPGAAPAGSARTAASIAADDGGSTTALTIGIVLAVLLAGGTAGLALRRVLARARE